MHRQGDEQADGIPILVHGASVDTWNSGGKRQQTTVCFFLFAELVKSVKECDDEIQGTRVVHGPLLRIEFGSTDSKRFVHKRLRWCRTFEQTCEGFGSLELIDASSHTNDRDPCRNQVDIGSADGSCWRNLRYQHQHNTFSCLNK